MKGMLILGLCGSLFLCCCVQKKSDSPHSLLIEGISNENPKEIFSLYSDIILFCKIKNDEMLGYLTVDRMNNIFSHDSLFSKMNYNDFVYGIVNQKIALKSEYTRGDFVPDSQILLSYSQLRFSDFLITYTDSIDENEYRIRSTLSFEETLTTIYCLFQHNYYTGYDDISGFYYSSRLDSLRKKPEDIPIEFAE